MSLPALAQGALSAKDPAGCGTQPASVHLAVCGDCNHWVPWILFKSGHSCIDVLNYLMAF